MMYPGIYSYGNTKTIEDKTCYKILHGLIALYFGFSFLLIAALMIFKMYAEGVTLDSLITFFQAFIFGIAYLLGIICTLITNPNPNLVLVLKIIYGAFACLAGYGYISALLKCDKSIIICILNMLGDLFFPCITIAALVCFFLSLSSSRQVRYLMVPAAQPNIYA